MAGTVDGRSARRRTGIVDRQINRACESRNKSGIIQPERRAVSREEFKNDP